MNAYLEVLLGNHLFVLGVIIRLEYRSILIRVVVVHKSQTTDEVPT